MRMLASPPQGRDSRMSSLDPLLPRAAAAPRLSNDLLGSVAALVKVADMVVVAGSGLLAYALRVDQLALPEAPRYTYALLAAAALTLLVFGRLSLYRQGPQLAPTMVAGRVLTGWAIVLSVLMSISFLSATGAAFSRLLGGMRRCRSAGRATSHEGDACLVVSPQHRAAAYRPARSARAHRRAGDEDPAAAVHRD